MKSEDFKYSYNSIKPRVYSADVFITVRPMSQHNCLLGQLREILGVEEIQLLRVLLHQSLHVFGHRLRSGLDDTII